MNWKASYKTKRTNNIGIYNEAGTLLASLDVHQLASPNVAERRMAQAQMMAAAPEMLHELSEILSWAETERAPLRQQEIDSIRAVIAKAKG